MVSRRDWHCIARLAPPGCPTDTTETQATALINATLRGVGTREDRARSVLATDR
jgi:hypothetical protein